MSKNITIRVIDATIINGAHAELGSIHDLPESEALPVIWAGRAVRHVEPEVVDEPAPVVETAAIAPAPETASAAPAKRRK